MKNSCVFALIGMTGCGKSTIGKMTAKRIKCTYHDLDNAISLNENISIPEIFEKHGEAYFRNLELLYLSKLISTAPKKQVTLISCGGGAPTNPKVFELLQNSCNVIWIKRGIDSVSQNVNVFSRPPIYGKRLNYIKLYNNRKPIYTSLCDNYIYNYSPNYSAKKLAKIIDKVKLKLKEGD